ncbi:major facilitator superfamily domain-containing protein [Suillus bovinus]|uniref:major facilitator superfamily domain-containing protein n=1 Tax=Suillus bovinus TaxID=48563 RepID=UPI001B87E00C|nr:major facilitator superfamily domain-containing protein [Suillus bovinus]KAG2154195.1 major facilitator superfamily domain-containing protein [Suillus bovinus]
MLDEEKRQFSDEKETKSTSDAAGNNPIVISDEEKRLVRKLDRRILPITCLLYLFAYLDRTNLGNARLQGLTEENLGGDPTGTLYDWVNSAFFFSYIIFQVPATITSKLFPPSYWIAGAAVGWGICSTLMATTFNFGSLMAARVALGIFEAGFGPAIPLYFSFFYTRTEMGLRMAYWFGFAAVAGAFGGLIAFGGIPALLLGVLTFFALPDRPESTRYLNAREKELVMERMNRGTSADIGAVVNKEHIIIALLDWRIYTGGMIYFGVNCALASISAFLPTIIETFGYTNALAQLLTVPPYAVAAIVLCMTSYTSDRIQNRGLAVAGACTVGAIGYLLLLTVPNNVHVRYFAVFCITSGTYTAIGLIIAWFAHNLGSETKKATGIPMFMAIGQCGSILGSHIYPSTDGPRYISGFAISCGLEAFATVCALVLWVSYKYDNAKRDREYGRPDPGANVDTSELADKAPMFRYIA